MAEARAAGRELGLLEQQAPVNLGAGRLFGEQVGAETGFSTSMRRYVKSSCGDGYNGAFVPTGGGWLRSLLGTGGRCLVPYEKDMRYLEWMGSAFPPHIAAARPWATLVSDDALQALVVPLRGARYECHGLHGQPVPLLLSTEPVASCEAMAEKAADHAGTLTGFLSLAADTVGYGYGLKNEAGAPLLAVYLGELARDMQLPYILDNRQGWPLASLDLAQLGAQAMVHSSPLAGTDFLVAQEDIIYVLQEDGHVVKHPEAEALLLAHLGAPRSFAEQHQEALDDVYELIVKEARSLSSWLVQRLRLTKSWNFFAVEINYESSWEGGGWGLPLFDRDDERAGDHLLKTALGDMNIIPPHLRGGNALISPPLSGGVRGTAMEKGIQGFFRVLEILEHYSNGER